MKVLGIALFMSLAIFVVSDSSNDITCRQYERGGRTFWVISKNEDWIDWTGANTWCKNHKNGTLAILDTNQTQSLKRKVPDGKKLWVGLRLYNGTTLRWVNGKVANLTVGLEYNEVDNKKPCYRIKHKDGDGVFLKRKKCCRELNGMICENGSSTASPSGWPSCDKKYERGGRTFWFIFNNQFRLNWTEANAWCKYHKKGTLAILDTDQKQSLKRKVPDGKHLWVGLRLYNGTKLRWVNGKVANLTVNLYDKVKYDKPCYHIKHPNEDGVFLKHKKCCKELRGMICENGSSMASPSGIHSTLSATQSTQQLLTTSGQDTSNPEASPTSTIRYMTTSAVGSRVEPTPTISSSSQIKNIHSTPSATQSTQQLLATTGQDISNPEASPTSTIRYMTTSAVGSRVEPTTSSVNHMETSSIEPNQPSSSSSYTRASSNMNPAKTSSVQPSTTVVPSATAIPEITSSPVVNKDTSSIEASQPSSSSSYIEASSSYIDPAKTSSVQLSTTVVPGKTANTQNDTNMINHFHEVMKNLNTSKSDCMSVLLSEYDVLMKWIDNKKMEYNLLEDAQDIENIALEFTKQHLSSNRTKMNISNSEIAFHAMLVDANSDSDVIFPEAEENPDMNTISLPKSLFTEQETYIVNVVYKNNKTVRKLPPSVMEGPDDKKNLTVNTQLFSMTIFPKRKEPFEYVNITLHHLQIKSKDAEPRCSFWNFSIPSTFNGSWSEQGCHLVSSTDKHTVCACNHLTHFAVLMNLNPNEVPSEHQEAMLIITYVGLALSLLGEAITVLLYCLFLNLRHEKIQIRVNLLCALAAAQIVFLAGIDETDNKGVCIFIASLIHLLYLVCFCWMLLEGVYLYRMVVKVFDAHITMRYAYIFAFGFPSFVVAVSLIAASVQSEGIYSYIDTRYCWVRFHNNFIWSFITPILILIAINCFFLFSVLKEMASMKSVKTINSLELSSIRASARACVVLLPLLGITWLFGLLTAVGTGIVWQYVFTILNAMQGFMIFVFHCLRNTELRAAIELRYFQWESAHSHHNRHSGRSTPSKFLTLDESEKSRSNSIPMATKANQVSPNSGNC